MSWRVLLVAVSVIITARLTARAAVDLVSFEAVPDVDQRLVRLTWETASENENLGFYIQRALDHDGDFERLPDPDDAEFIPAHGGAGGWSYAYDDADVELGETYYYRLEAIDTSMHSDLYGPVSAALYEPSTPTRTPTPTPSATATPQSTSTSGPPPYSTPSPRPATATTQPTPTVWPTTATPRATETKTPTHQPTATGTRASATTAVPTPSFSVTPTTPPPSLAPATATPSPTSTAEATMPHQPSPTTRSLAAGVTPGATHSSTAAPSPETTELPGDDADESRVGRCPLGWAALAALLGGAGVALILIAVRRLTRRPKR